MCLGVPGKVLSIEPDALGVPMGKVSFAGITKEVCLGYTPEAEVGDYVVVHVGFAISRIDEEEAAEVFRFLEEMDELGELDIPQPAGRAGDPEPSGGRPS
ncbi:MAG: HypC/HybG/HupF family hydrogenase formation chaperone [Thermoanaerobaculia bacterium]|nr:HypC/HybG/HupF family hydrogenase formation chaperone [Thermoanaerobaculia bacterium]